MPKNILIFLADMRMQKIATGRLMYLIDQRASAAGSGHRARLSQLLLWCSHGAMLWTLYAYGRAIFTYNQRYPEKW